LKELKNKLLKEVAHPRRFELLPARYFSVTTLGATISVCNLKGMNSGIGCATCLRI
jgi:hypothetical protein